MIYFVKVMEKKLQIAVLMTCYNRRDVTLKTLHSLFEQEILTGVTVSVYVVDDGSSDGTSEAITKNFPGVILLQGTGSLFWGGGMRLAMAEAISHGYDFYLWLNDDTLLTKKAILVLLQTYFHQKKLGYEQSIVVGSAKDIKSGELTYGGVVRCSRWHPLRFKRVHPADKPLQCDTINGNLVLIPQAVVDKVGNLDTTFTHAAGDFDYGLRAGQMGCTNWIAPGYLAFCSRNRCKGNWWDSRLDFKEWWGKMQGSKGIPIWERKVYIRRHGGFLWFFLWLGPYIKYIGKYLKMPS